jgi:uncharacterized membrane protein
MRHRQAIAVLALVGFFVSLYLWFYKIGVIGGLKCGTGSCEYVQTSRWATLLGQPVALYGVAGYLVLFLIALAGLQPRFLSNPGPTRLLAALALAGFAFTLYLTYLELFVIHAVCRWCMGSAVIITLITVIAVPAVLRGERGEGSGRSR